MGPSKRSRSEPGPEIQQQIYPYSLQTFNHGTVFRRTAPIKNHLRSQVRTADKISTYEHDFGRSVQQINPLSARSVSSYISTTRSENTARRDPDLRAKVAKEGRDDLLAGKRNFTQTGGTETIDTLKRLQEQGRGLHLNVTGWGGTHFTPAKFPHMFKGTSDRWINLQQNQHTLNLRAPELYHRNNHSSFPRGGPARKNLAPRAKTLEAAPRKKMTTCYNR